MRESGPGLGAQISGAGEAVAMTVQDAVAALDAALARSRAESSSRPEGRSRPAEAEPETARPDGTQPDTGPPGPAGQDSTPVRRDEGPVDEPDDRD
jgi:hypothetical protein